MMEESVPDQPVTTVKVQEVLHSLAELLRGGPPLGPEAQQILADIIDQLGSTVTTEVVPPAEVGSLAQHVSALINAATEAEVEDTGVLGGLRARLEATAAAVESRAPLLAGLTRRLIDTLTEIGI